MTPLSLLNCALALTTAACSSCGSLPTPTPRTPVPDLDVERARALAQGSNAFAVQLWKAMEHDGNEVISPASIAVALTMAWGGARGQTATEMAGTLHLEGDPARAHETLAGILGSWNASEAAYVLHVANRLFGDQRYPFKASFLELTRERYRAELQPMDFVHDAADAREAINGWVSDETAERIRGLLPEGHPSADTRLVLVNAVYFKARWTRPFEPRATRAQPFHLDASQTADVPTMYQDDRFAYGEVDGVKVLEIGYRGGALSMMIALPDAVEGLAAMEADLSAATLTRWADGSSAQQVQVALPRFRIARGTIGLAELLRGLGMEQAFDRARADFGGIADPPSPAERLFLGAVFHQAFVAVDEEGTEAAAATAVEMEVTAVLPPDEPKRFVADHPFLFFIRDTRTGQILFMGRVTDPHA